MDSEMIKEGKNNLEIQPLAATLGLAFDKLERELAEKKFIISSMNMRINRDMLLYGETIARLHKLSIELKKLESLKDSLTHMIVHDLNNPLTAVSGNLQLLQMGSAGTLSDEQKDDLRQALFSVNELKTMINNLLDISKMEEGMLIISSEYFNLRGLLQEVVNEMKSMAQEEGKKLSLEIAENMPQAKADKELIRRVIANLINNAIKHTPGEGEVTVKTFYKDADKEFCVQVIDTGAGIPKEYLTKIFEKFFQLEDKEARTGHGLGLTFCKMAVEAHGGRIWVESEVRQGSTFYFTIPAKE